MPKRRKSKPERRSRPLSPHQQEEQVKCLAAINRVRRGEAKTVSAAARSEGTTIRAIRALVPKALSPSRADGRIRVKPTDPYSAPVEILTESGSVVTMAHGSRERELAGRHRATWLGVVRGQQSRSALKKFRNKRVGSQELLSDYAQLASFARAGVLGQLDSLYVSPDTAA